MNLNVLQSKLRDFAAERDWQPFHTPKNLAMALIVEAAELAEIFQWMTPDQSQTAHTDPDMQQRIADEVADVLLYLLQIADHTAVDIERAVAHKLGKNAKKHPALRQTPPPVEDPVSGPRTHVLVDWENVQPKDVDIRALVPDVTDVWLFHGPNQKNVDAHQLSFGERATRVPIARAGKNALDFHLSFYMGYIASRRPQARFVVISNDKGYGPMLEHMIDLGFAAKQLGFGNGKSTTSNAHAKPSMARPVATKKVATTAPPQQPGSAVAPVVKAVTPKKTTAAKKKSVPAKTATPAKKSVGAKKVVPGKKAGITTPAAKAVPAKSSTPAKKTAKTATSQVSATSPPKSASANSSPLTDLNKAVQHIQASLKKTTARPARKAKLLASIKSLLGASADEQKVQVVLDRLLVGGKVLVDEKDAVRYKF